MLRQSPKGGRPLKEIGGLDWDETHARMQFKLGYCSCGNKVLATKDELQEIVTTFSHMVQKLSFKHRLAKKLIAWAGVDNNS